MHRNQDEGATAVEYALMASLIALAVIGTVTSVGVALNGIFGGPIGSAL